MIFLFNRNQLVSSILLIQVSFYGDSQTNLPPSVLFEFEEKYTNVTHFGCFEKKNVIFQTELKYLSR